MEVRRPEMFPRRTMFLRLPGGSFGALCAAASGRRRNISVRSGESTGVCLIGRVDSTKLRGPQWWELSFAVVLQKVHVETFQQGDLLQVNGYTWKHFKMFRRPTQLGRSKCFHGYAIR